MPLIVESLEHQITLITIDNQSKCNAMSRDMMAQLAELWDELEHSRCRCVIITGAGERAFCAGADLGGDLSASAHTAVVVNRALIKNTVFSKPIVAAVNGDCVGGGLELLLSTDIRLTVSHARFGLPEVHWSVYPFGGATVKLIQQIGYARAMDLLLTARLVDAAFAERIGLVNEVVPASQLMSHAIDRAKTIAANSPSAVQAVKQQISAMISEHALAREALEQQLGDRVRASSHFSEGVKAFLEKRQPNYD